MNLFMRPSPLLACVTYNLHVLEMTKLHSYTDNTLYCPGSACPQQKKFTFACDVYHSLYFSS